jgi:hypothetical protein
MKQLPKTEHALVLRTDFSNQAAWEAICAAIRAPVGELRAFVDFLDDAEYAGATKDQLLGLVPEGYDHTFLIVVDRTAISHPDHPLLLVNLWERSGQEFRAIPAEIQGIENNLSIANMDFEDFADAVDETGVFRGFPEA